MAKEVFDNERYISEDIKEGNNKEVRKEQNLKKMKMIDIIKEPYLYLMKEKKLK